jgi:outer membrane protein
MKKTLLYLLVAISLPFLAHATDLIDIYQQALENDPVFKQAYSDYMSTSEAILQARSALLPQLYLSGQAGHNFNNLGNSRLNRIYNSDQWQLTASQALFNYEAWAQVQQAKATVKVAQANFNDAAQVLILRTANAYFQALLAKDTLNFAEAKKRANERQLDQAKQRVKVGLEPITSVYEATAAYDQSVATVIAARSNQTNQFELLRQLTNHLYVHLSPLRRIPLIKPEPNNVNVWVDTGLKQNYKLFAAKYSLQAARENIKAQSAGNWPNIALQGNATHTFLYSRPPSAPAPAFTLPSLQTTSNLALTMSFPVFQGGLVLSKTKQAQYDFQTVSQQLEQTCREIVANSHIAFNTITNGVSKVKADRRTIISQKNSLESTEAQFQAGTRTMVDVINAQQRLFEAQEQLASDQYNLINAILQLKYLAGTLKVADLEEVNSWLATEKHQAQPINGP